MVDTPTKATGHSCGGAILSGLGPDILGGLCFSPTGQSTSSVAEFMGHAHVKRFSQQLNAAPAKMEAMLAAHTLT